MKSEIRIPESRMKSKARMTQGFALFAPFASLRLCAFERRISAKTQRDKERKEIKRKSEFSLLRISSFGFDSDFGFRASDL